MVDSEQMLIQQYKLLEKNSNCDEIILYDKGEWDVQQPTNDYWPTTKMQSKSVRRFADSRQIAEVEVW